MLWDLLGLTISWGKSCIVADVAGIVENVEFQVPQVYTQEMKKKTL